LCGRLKSLQSVESGKVNDFASGRGSHKQKEVLSLLFALQSLVRVEMSNTDSGSSDDDWEAIDDAGVSCNGLRVLASTGLGDCPLVQFHSQFVLTICEPFCGFRGADSGIPYLLVAVQTFDAEAAAAAAKKQRLAEADAKA
jgi:hypothetical protein